MFQLNQDELNSLRFQFETTNMSRSLPYAFTEEGVVMLSAILKTEVAEQISVAIMDAFVAMRHYISNNLLEQKYINDLVLKHDNEINILKETFSSFKTNENSLFFEG